MNIKNTINKILKDAILDAFPDTDLNLENIKWEVPFNKDNGDYASNAGMILAKQLRKPPMEIASNIIEKLSYSGFSNITVAAPGFINIKIKNSEILDCLLNMSESLVIPNRKKVYIEYVSVNPTGPLHVGHGRNVMYGSLLSKVFSNLGHNVYQEYYLNDAGRQMDILAISVIMRIFDIKPIDNTYKGDYIKDIANEFISLNNFKTSDFDISLNIKSEHPEEILDETISYLKDTLKNTYEDIFNFTLLFMVENIKDDLNNFGVKMHWFSEQSLLSTGLVNEMLEKIQPYCYKKDNALWFKATEFGDEKDRVLVRSNNENTYFANDLAYHYYKLSTNFDLIINVWGADHHGYLPRIEAGLKALGQDINRLKVIFIQFATLFKGKQKLQMSTRSGEFITLDELSKEISVSATKFFYSIRKQDQHLEFDLELAKKKTNENPLFYIQYAHARICSVFNKYDKNFDIINTKNIVLDLDAEKDLMLTLLDYNDTLVKISENYQVHMLPNYLLNLATKFHSYYNNYPIITSDENTTLSRLFLANKVKDIIAKGLNIMNIKPLESM